MKRYFKVLVGIAVTGILIYGLLSHSSQIRRSTTDRDSIAYWATGTLLIQHGNPYSHASILELEKEQGYREPRPLVLRTPPWSLFMVAALGLTSPLWAWVAWIALSMCCLVASIRLCAEMYGNSMTPRNLSILIGYTFAPVPACLVSGQMGLVLMMGFLLFLLLERSRPFLAGAVLVIPFAKPHLFTLVWVALIIWGIRSKAYAVGLGFLTSLALAISFALSLDHHVFQQYREMLHAATIGNEFIPAFSGVIRLLFFRRFFWVQFVPLALAMVWCVHFLFRNLPSWDWRQHGPALLIVSVLATPYEWLSDESVLLPAIIQAAILVYEVRAKLTIKAKIGITVFALLNILLLLILRAKVPFTTGIYFWSSLVWFFWYFRAWKWHERFGAHRAVAKA